MKLLLFFAIAAFSLPSCNGSIKEIFGSRSARDAYAKKIESTPEGKQWISASTSVLVTPVAIQLPYRHRGFFPRGKPRALALLFFARHGEKIRFELASKGGSAITIFADLFRKDSNDVDHLMSADTTEKISAIDVEENGSYILRLQPPLNDNGEYNLTISVSPTLGFPVAGKQARIGSFWGDSRDAGGRRHEGIDIFAPKLTAAIAADEGHISNVTDGGLGGKTVWLNVKDRSFNLYYAHLDQQLVEPGQYVDKGDTIGLIGNSGNARFTPSHLHFGIYGRNGAIDPYPFINHNLKEAPEVPYKNLMDTLILKHSSKSRLPEKQDTLIPLASNAAGYLAATPAGTVILTSFDAVRSIRNKAIRKGK